MIRGQFTGWGVSKLEGIVRTWNQYLKQQEVVYELTDEAKVDVFRLEGFKETLASPDGAQKAAARVQLSAELKNYKNALVLDKEDEYESKAVSFGGIAEIINENRKGISADFGYPMTKLFGISAAGFNAGEDDLETYNAKVESDYRAKDRHIVLFIIQCRCQQLFGYIPETISFEFHPLRVLSAEQEETLKDKKLERILRAKEVGLITSEKAVELINAEKVFPLDLNSQEVEDVAPETEKTEGIAAGQSFGNLGKPA
jgi:phage-related protein (TIGR01555 family)